jgi:transcriptional regulator with XRE-family HTH domain
LEIGTIIRHARKSKGLTLEVLAERVGITTQRLWALEQGNGSIANVVAAIDAMGSDFVGGMPTHGKTLHERFAHKRQQMGLSVDDLAHKAGIKRATVLSVESGKGHLRSLNAIAGVLMPRLKIESRQGMRIRRERDICLTPPDVLAKSRKIFGVKRFCLDPCSNGGKDFVRAKCFFDIGHDGLSQEWDAEVAFVNPPFSQSVKWAMKAMAEWEAGRVGSVLLLIPVRSCVLDFKKYAGASDTKFLEGRMKFYGRDMREMPHDNPTHLALHGFGLTRAMAKRLDQEFAGYFVPCG